MPEEQMQAKDIPESTFLAAVRDAARPWGTTIWGDLTAHLSTVMGTDVPAKVVLAKAKRLIDAGKMDGCPCGCRGDFYVVEGTA